MKKNIKEKAKKQIKKKIDKNPGKFAYISMITILAFLLLVILITDANNRARELEEKTEKETQVQEYITDCSNYITEVEDWIQKTDNLDDTYIEKLNKEIDNLEAVMKTKNQTKIRKQKEKVKELRSTPIYKPETKEEETYEDINNYSSSIEEE